MYDTLRRLLAESLQVEPDAIQPDTRLADLARDSMDIVELTMLCEDRFDVAIPDEAAEQLEPLQMTVRELAMFLELHRTNRDNTETAQPPLHPSSHEGDSEGDGYGEAGG